MKFVIVTGLSGSGKSEAMRSLEDMGFYCVDNLPPALIPKFAELCYQSNSTIDKVALGIDVRGRKFFKALHESLNVLRKDKYPFEILYLDCSDDILLKRYKMTRRNHPLAINRQIPEGIKIEIVDLNRMDIGPLDMKAGCKNLERLPATPHMHKVLAEAYAKERGFDADECYKLMVAYRSTQPGKIDGLY